ncbi:hypothetical protein DYB37_009697 [Aphanomyces astaci]|uniref:Uncharacterized protein n=1 Tax=Aphanomyces astaci TaxID=112090 RepID=A0A418FAH4_APHAT|nr:hypothetical protein DYB37_009697 [Aphanomyces astaci]
MDESYIDYHYKRHDNSLYDLDVRVKEAHKGSRYSIAGILDSATLDSPYVALNIFTGGKFRAKEPKDYHAMFNHDYFCVGLIDYFKN